MTDLEEGFIDVGTGGPLRYLRGGNPAGEKLLLLHGVHLSADYFRRSLYPHLRERYAVLALDLRGHGKSFRSDEPYTVENHARDVLAFHGRLLGEPCHVIGFSLGGNVALAACTRAPELARKLVVVDVAPFVNRAGLERILAAQRALPERFESLEALQSFFYAAYRGISKVYVDEVLQHMWRKDDRGRYVTTYDRRIWHFPPDAMQAELLALADAAEGLTLPVLLLRGGSSDILSREGAERFLARLPNGHLVEIPGADHGLLHEHPEACAQVIRSFVEG